jgi:hypothetical protein
MNDPDYIAYRAIVAAIAGRLAEISPDLPVTVSEYGRARKSIFIIGILSIGGSGGLAALTISGGRAALLGEAFTPVALLSVLGLALAWGNAPWRPRVSVPVVAFARALGAPNSGSSSNS